MDLVQTGSRVRKLLFVFDGYVVFTMSHDVECCSTFKYVAVMDCNNGIMVVPAFPEMPPI